MNLDYAKIKEAAQNYQKDMTKFLREIVWDGLYGTTESLSE